MNKDVAYYNRAPFLPFGVSIGNHYRRGRGRAVWVDGATHRWHLDGHRGRRSHGDSPGKARSVENGCCSVRGNGGQGATGMGRRRCRRALRQRLDVAVRLPPFHGNVVILQLVLDAFSFRFDGDGSSCIFSGRYRWWWRRNLLKIISGAAMGMRNAIG